MGNDCNSACNVCKNSETVIDATAFPGGTIYEDSKNFQ